MYFLFRNFPDTPIPSMKFVKSGKDHVPLHIKWSQKLPRWNSSELIAATLQHHANDGDFQTAVCVLLVLGEKRRYLTKTTSVDEVVQEQWLLSYIDTLNRYKLWNIATEVHFNFLLKTKPVYVCLQISRISH